MKGLTVVLSLVLSIFSLTGAVLVNHDKPLKGTWDFKPEKLWEVSTFNEDALAMVQRFVITENGGIIVFDRRHFKFFVYDSNGKPLYKFGTRGEGPGEIKLVLDFYLVNDKIIIYDLGRIIYLDRKGKFLKTELINSNIGIAPFLFLDEHRFIKSRRSLSALGHPESLEIFDIRTNSSTYLVGKAPEPVKGGPQGISVMISIGSDRAERNSGFVVARAGSQIFWGQNDTYQIQACDFTGKENFTFSIQGRERKKISEDYKKRLVSRMRFRTDGNEKAIRQRLLKRIPDICTYFSRIIPDKNGLLYVFASDAERENGELIDIFSPRGKYLYQGEISLPEGHRIIANGMVFKGDYLYMVVQDPDGDFTFNKYRITLPVL